MNRIIEDEDDTQVYEIHDSMDRSNEEESPVTARVFEQEFDGVEHNYAVTIGNNKSYSPMRSNANENDTLHVQLRDWMTLNHVPMLQVDKLLAILRDYHPELPIDSRSLLVNPKSSADSLPIQKFMQRSKASQTTIMEMIEQLKAEVKSNHRVILKKLNNKSPSSESDDSIDGNPTDMPTLPVSTEEELQELEDYISASASNESNLIRYLAQIGGSSRDDALRRILSKVISKSCAANFSYLGKKHKKPFHELGLNAVIHGALRSHKEHRFTSDHDVQVVVSNWLKLAPKCLREKTLEYQCGKCPKQFTHLRHYRAHQDECGKQFACNICDKLFRSKANLTQHISHVHVKQKRHECHMCKKLFQTKWDLEVHCRLHSGEKPFECSVCGKAFSLKSNMTRHAHIHLYEKFAIGNNTSDSQ